MFAFCSFCYLLLPILALLFDGCCMFAFCLVLLVYFDYFGLIACLCCDWF